MKLLFDKNISYKLVTRVGDVYPESKHVRQVGLAEADDAAVWDYARDNHFVIVSKDEDFHQKEFSVWFTPKGCMAAIG